MFVSKANFVILTFIIFGGSESKSMEVDEDLLDEIFGPYSDSIEEQVLVSYFSVPLDQLQLLLVLGSSN